MGRRNAPARSNPPRAAANSALTPKQRIEQNKSLTPGQRATALEALAREEDAKKRERNRAIATLAANRAKAKAKRAANKRLRAKGASIAASRGIAATAILLPPHKGKGIRRTRSDSPRGRAPARSPSPVILRARKESGRIVRLGPAAPAKPRLAPRAKKPAKKVALRRKGSPSVRRVLRGGSGLLLGETSSSEEEEKKSTRGKAGAPRPNPIRALVPQTDAAAKAYKFALDEYCPLLVFNTYRSAKNPYILARVARREEALNRFYTLFLKTYGVDLKRRVNSDSRAKWERNIVSKWELRIRQERIERLRINNSHFAAFQTALPGPSVSTWVAPSAYFISEEETAGDPAPISPKSLVRYLVKRQRGPDVPAESE